MSGLCAIDGQIAPVDRAVIPISDRGFLFGDAVFETLRTYGRQPFRFSEHLARLGRSLALAKIDHALDEIEAEVHTLTAALAASSSDELYIRIMVTRGDGPLSLSPRTATRSRRVTWVEPLGARVPRRAGIACAMVPTYRPGDALRGAKVQSYLESITLLEAAAEHGADEVLVVDALGHVPEGATSNLFLVKDGVLRTPDPEGSVLAGITRAVTLDLASTEGLPVALTPLTPTDVRSADEVFVTSTLKEITFVHTLDGERRWPEMGPLTARLQQAFARLVSPD